MKLKLEMDISTLEMQQKRSKVRELEETLDDKKAIYKDLKKNIDRDSPLKNQAVCTPNQHPIHQLGLRIGVAYAASFGAVIINHAHQR